uniref:Uncharacterized protein n=1 Tax=Rhizophora mucronata TaxID=61149 RepID=A0A2P2JDS1_RHIMU
MAHNLNDFHQTLYHHHRPFSIYLLILLN